MLIFLSTKKVVYERANNNGISRKRMYMPLGDICKEYKVDFLIELAKEIDKLKYKEKPNYNNLVFLLEKSLLDLNIAPAKQYNWISN